MVEILENIRLEEVGRKRFLDEITKNGGFKWSDSNFRISLAKKEASLRITGDRGSVTYFVFKNGR